MDLINTYAQYDDESDEWQIKYIALSGNNIAQTRRIVETGQMVASSKIEPTNGDQLEHEGENDEAPDKSTANKESGEKRARKARRRKEQAEYSRADPFIRL